LRAATAGLKLRLSGTICQKTGIGAHRIKLLKRQSKTLRLGRAIMLRTTAITAGIGVLLIGTTAGAADPEQSSPHMLVLGQHAGAAPPPTILRGSVAAPAPETMVENGGGNQTQIVAGQQLWLVDGVTGEVQSCINLQTTTVGVRDIQCTVAELGDYSRTFGPNFHP
jgi:hypothetical protein